MQALSKHSKILKYTAIKLLAKKRQNSDPIVDLGLVHKAVRNKTKWVYGLLSMFIYFISLMETFSSYVCMSRVFSSDTMSSNI